MGAAVCPGAPFLVDGTAATVAGKLAPVVRACLDAVARLPQVDLAVLLTTRPPASSMAPPESPAVDQPPWRLLAPGSVIGTSPIRRSDLPDRLVSLPGPPAQPSALLADLLSRSPPIADPGTVAASVGTIVGASLLAAGADPSGAASTDHRTATRTAARVPAVAIEVSDPMATAVMIAGLVNGPDGVALLVVADGAACHGDDAPGRHDDRSGPFDAVLAHALGNGDPQALLRACDPGPAAELLASTKPLEVLALLTQNAPPTSAELLYAGAPRGVGYLVATWSWSAS